jgi:hypothetical protein
MDLYCTVCSDSARTDQELAPGWRKLWIDVFGQLFTSSDLRRGVTGYEGMTAIEEAVSCGQRHTLALTERYLDRGTFAVSSPSQLAPDAAADELPVVDAFQALT